MHPHDKVLRAASEEAVEVAYTNQFFRVLDWVQANPSPNVRPAIYRQQYISRGTAELDWATVDVRWRRHCACDHSLRATAQSTEG